MKMNHNEEKTKPIFSVDRIGLFIYNRDDNDIM